MRGGGVIAIMAIAGCGLGTSGSLGPVVDGGGSLTDGAPAVPAPPGTTLPLEPRACVPPQVSVGFGEAAGTTTTSDGLVGGVGTFALQAGFPVFSTDVPTGAFAPPANKSAIDFGPIGTTDGGRAIDFPMELARATEGRIAFTVTGWINLRKHDAGAGGDRIMSTHIQNNSGGFDLSVDDTGKLWLGVNGYTDGGGVKSSHTIDVDQDVPADKWEFFAVVYDAKTSQTNDGTVSFYFGSGTEAAKLDKATDYDQGAVMATRTLSLLSVGNFAVDSARNAPGATSRVVRGLLDELRFFDRALGLDEILCHQKNLR